VSILIIIFFDWVVVFFAIYNGLWKVMEWVQISIKDQRYSIQAMLSKSIPNIISKQKVRKQTNPQEKKTPKK
jgi:predicted ATPase